VIFQEGAPLVGQSEHLLNFQVGMEDTESLSQLTVLGQLRVRAGGPPRGSASPPVYPDRDREPGAEIDVVLAQGFRSRRGRRGGAQP
jgi:hypothetical protein